MRDRGGTLRAAHSPRVNRPWGNRYVPAVDIDSKIQPFRQLAVRSLALAFALLLHLGLLLILLRPPLPWPLRGNLPPNTDDHRLRLDLLSASRRVATAITGVAPHLLRMHARPAPRPSVAVMAHASASASAAPRPTTRTAAAQPFSPLPIPYGNSRFTRALHDAQSDGLPQLPGANAIPRAPSLVLAPPASLKSRLHAVGKWLYCKNAIFKRRMTDQELLKRGLTRRQMNQAFAAECTP